MHDHPSVDDAEATGIDCHHTEPSPAEGLARALDRDISRSQLLKALSGGAAFLMASGAAGLDTALAASPRTSEPSGGPAHAEYLCMIVMDGGRPDYITNNLAALPNVHALMKRGRWYNNAWVGSLMSITPPDHAVLGTGSFPRNDGGIVNWDWGDHATGKISPTTQAVETFLNGWVFKLMKDSGTPTLSGLIREKYPDDMVIAGSGAHFHAAGPLGGPDASFIFSYQRENGYWGPFSLLPGHPVPDKLLHDPALRAPLPRSNQSTVPLTYDPLLLGQQDSLIVDFAIKALEHYRPRAIMINLPESDTVGHWSLKWHLEQLRVYRSLDQSLGRIVDAYKTAGIFDKTLFVLTADHGMIQSKDRVLDHIAVENQIKKELGEHSIILTNGGGSAGPTMTSIWLKNPANNARMAKALFAHHYDNVSAILYMDRTKGSFQIAGVEQADASLTKTYLYMANTMAGPHAPDIAILLRENARNSGLPRMLGRHGGGDWGSQHMTLLFSGPGVKIGASNAPARLVDIAPTIERFMGITPKARDGIVLADAFQKPYAPDLATQRESDLEMTTHVGILVSRARNDIALAAAGKLPNTVPAHEMPVVRWKRRLAVSAAGPGVLVGTGAGLVKAVSAVKGQGTGLEWDE